MTEISNNTPYSYFHTLIAFIRLGCLISFYATKGAIVKKRQGELAFFHLMKEWGRKMTATLGVEISVEGENNINPNEVYVIIANHTSLLDIPILLAALPNFICFMYKKELEKVPILGFGLKHSAFIPIERENPKDAIRSVDKAINLVNNSLGSVILFPEGTRSKDGKVGIFKRGAFFIASKTNKKIVPVSIIGLNKILPAGKFRLYKGKIKIIINTPIDKIPEERIPMKNAIKNIYDMIKKQVES